MFKRQFILGKENLMPEWDNIKVNGKYILSYESNLNVSIESCNNKEIVLIGYVIDPKKPDNTNIDVLKTIMSEMESPKDILELTYGLTGRYIFIATVDNATSIVSDLSGFRQIFYYENEGSFYLASQPNLLSYVLDIPKTTNQDFIDFVESPYFKYYQNFIVGDQTIFDRVYHLMPNHYIELEPFLIHRYWINKEKHNSYEEAVEKSAEILKGSQKAISLREQPIQGLTAGMDSRVLLAASKDYLSDFLFYTSSGDKQSNRNVDLKIGSQLAKEFDLNYHVISDLGTLRQDIIKKLNVDVSLHKQISKTRTIQYFYDNFPNNINVNGAVSEIARHQYGHIDMASTPQELAEKVGYGDFNFVIKELEKWLNGIPEEVKNDMEISDLFFWEQREGNWAALQKAEQDIALDDFSPFNNRELIMTLYEVDSNKRIPENYTLYRDIIEYLWPELLKYPINPISFKEVIINKTRNFIPKEVKQFIKRYRKI